MFTVCFVCVQQDCNKKKQKTFTVIKTNPQCMLIGLFDKREIRNKNGMFS